VKNHHTGGSLLAENSVRLIAVTLLLNHVLLVFSPTTAAAAAADSTTAVVFTEKTVNDINESLRGASGRVVTTFATLSVEKPKATPYGLAFRKTPGYPPHRPALVTEVAWDTIPPAPNPIPWSQVRSIEAKRSHAMAIGIASGVITGLIYARTNNADESVAWAGAVIPASVAFGVGYLLGGWTEHWDPVYAAIDTARGNATK
jgi:hypothetical protein